jgi:phosphonoacetaldehyde hydrolase
LTSCTGCPRGEASARSGSWALNLDPMRLPASQPRRLECGAVDDRFRGDPAKTAVPDGYCFGAKASGTADGREQARYASNRMTNENRLRGVIFDWAGTVVDFGSLAPTRIFVEAFATFDIVLTPAQASAPTGLSKREHIEALLAEPAIATQWRQRFSRYATQTDVDAIYTRYTPMQIEKIGEYSAPIPGAVETLASLRRRGVKLGSCSGYPRRVMDVLIPLARESGIEFDYVVAGDDLSARGRPGPYMALSNVIALRLGDVRACVKVDDTVAGVEEGRNAGMWSVGVALSGASAGWSLQEYRAASPAELEAVRIRTTERLAKAGAHIVIDTVADLPQTLAAIERRMREGERP